MKAFEIYYKQIQVKKQLALQSVAENQKQVKVAEERLAVLYRYQKEYAHDLEKVMQGGSTVNDFQYFLKFMAHLNKVVDDAKAYLAECIHQQHELQQRYVHLKHESDELLLKIQKEANRERQVVQKKQEAQLQDLYFMRGRR